MNRRQIERKVRDAAKVVSLYQYPTRSGNTSICIEATIGGKLYSEDASTKLGYGDKWCYQTGREVAFERAVLAMVDEVMADQPGPEKPKQPQVKRAVVVMHDMLWCDASHVDRIRDLPGVTRVIASLGKQEYRIGFNPCYDRDDVVAAIKAVVKSSTPESDSSPNRPHKRRSDNGIDH